MPMPLKKGYNVHVEYIEKPYTYVMRAADKYTDYYGIGFIISGDRQTITPDKISFAHAGNPSIETLASLAGLSESHFMKRFRECVGSSYKTYLHCYKVRLAQSMLINTKLSILQISEELGFCNANYFCKVFHKISGNSPREFREEHGSDG